MAGDACDMKFLPIISLTVALVGASPLFGQAEGTQQLLAEGQAAYVKGDLAAAKKSFELVNQLEPRNVTAINYLRLIKTREGRGPQGGGLEQQLSKIILPKVELKEATLGSAVEFLRQQANKASGGKTSVNVVLLMPDDRANTQTVTLQLQNVPFTEVLKYLGDLAALTVEYDAYAVRLKPKAGAAPGPATAAVLPGGGGVAVQGLPAQ